MYRKQLKNIDKNEKIKFKHQLILEEKYLQKKNVRY